MKKICLVFILGCCLVALQAQQCDEKLKQAINYENNRDYKKAASYYKVVMEVCGENYGNAKAKWKECQNKLNGGPAKTTPKNPSSGYVPQQSTGYLSNSQLFFDGEGVCRNSTSNIEVSVNGWDFDVPENCKNWLEVNRHGNTLVVTCQPNPKSMERRGSIFIIGEINVEIEVHQEAKSTSPKRTSLTDYTAQPVNVEPTQEDLSIIVKAIFEPKKSKPSFDNTENIIELLNLLNKDKNRGLEIEIPWCNSQKTVVFFKKYPMSLIDERINNITDHFAALGIDKGRISKIYKPIDVGDGNPECDCGYVKIKDSSAGNSK